MLVSTSTLFNVTNFISSLNEEQTNYFNETLQKILDSLSGLLISDNISLDTVSKNSVNVSLKDLFDDVFIPVEFIINPKEQQVFSQNTETETETLITHDEIQSILSQY